MSNSIKQVSNPGERIDQGCHKSCILRLVCFRCLNADSLNSKFMATLALTLASEEWRSSPASLTYVINIRLFGILDQSSENGFQSSQRRLLDTTTTRKPYSLVTWSSNVMTKKSFLSMFAEVHK